MTADSYNFSFRKKKDGLSASKETTLSDDDDSLSFFSIPDTPQV